MGEPATTRKAAWFYSLELALLVDGSFHVSLAATTVDEEKPQLLCQDILDECVASLDDAFARIKEVLTT